MWLKKIYKRDVWLKAIFGVERGGGGEVGVGVTNNLKEGGI